MAFSTLFVDGFDHYTTSDLLKKWSYIRTGTSATETIDTGVARNGGQSLKLAATSSTGNSVGKAIGMQAQTLVLGFALYATAFSDNWAIVGFGAGSLSNLNEGQFVLRLNANGTFTVGPGYISPNGVTAGFTALATSGTAISLNVWNYIEVRVYLHDTVGEYEVRLNGVNILSGTGDTKRQSGIAWADTVEIGRVNVSFVTAYFDDLYVRGDTVNTAGGFLGDCKVVTKYPQGAGSSTQFTPSAGSNWQTVDEATPNGDTDYVSSSTSGHKDLYDIAAVGTGSASIKAVQWNVYARKDDAGDRQIKLRTKSGATEDASANTGLSTNYGYASKIWENDPNTGSAWTATNLDAAEFGQEIV